MKTLSKIILLSFLSFFCLAQVSIAEECKDNPDQCTPKKLCDISTEVVNGLKFWKSNLEFDEHVKYAKDIGIDCGASDPKSPCDLDANECKISELCEKATITEGDDVLWNPETESHVELANEYGLSCGVKAENEVKSQTEIPNNTTVSNNTEKKVCPTFGQGDVGLCSNGEICMRAVRNGEWDKLEKFIPFVKEAKKRGLDCGIQSAPVVDNKNAPMTYTSMLKEIEGDWTGLIKCPDNQNFPFKGTFSTKPYHKIFFETDDFNYKGSFGLNHLENIVTVKSIRNDGQKYEGTLKYSRDLKQLTGQSEDCLVEATKSFENIAVKKVDFAQSFKKQPRLRRKQIQYALKELGFYQMTIDGLWGKGTRNALFSFANSYDLSDYQPEAIFRNLLYKVEVPSSFASPKPSSKSSAQTETKDGWIQVGGKAKLPFKNAREICLAKGEAEAQTYMNTYKPLNNSVNCYNFSGSSFSCSSGTSGGFVGGMLEGMNKGNWRKKAKEVGSAIAFSCMADYGWIKN